MNQRTTRTTVTFRRPFSLSGLENLPAGTYTVETEEELVAGLSFPAYCRTASFICLPWQPGSSVLAEMAAVDPLELQAAQERDAAAL